ncbi:hypothetical protein QA640_07020 [Bradyrhizobium sp. CB82]|uniref:hypothetical protein n=1 Tax=Bradyrhizobium sp. CB82 TaxID=3039159 RepID=UPI0024B13E8C|nr:hypothetical protein [Bradyrhizobium sp. CB82]WFU42220.1 hypothetical protein QA640_07020 [Bradyrhizobium sp. CB82]
MSWVSLQSDIIERRGRDGARVIYEDYTYFAEHDRRLSPKGEELAEIAEGLGMTREKLIAMRKWMQETTKRLVREMATVYTLNEQLDIVKAQHLPKSEAAELTGVVVPGELLDLDDVYGGLLVRRGYIFVSDMAREHGLKKYGPVELLNGLIDEQLVVYHSDFDSLAVAG